MKLDILDIETGEVLATVTTKYRSLEALYSNASRWRRRHPEYEGVSPEELKALGFQWDYKVLWVRHIA